MTIKDSSDLRNDIANRILDAIARLEVRGFTPDRLQAPADWGLGRQQLFGLRQEPFAGAARVGGLPARKVGQFEIVRVEWEAIEVEPFPPV